LLAAPALFTSTYATNRDGSLLYFSTPLRVRDSAQFFHPEILVWEQGKGLRLYEQRPLDAVSSTSSQPCPEAQFYSLDAVEVSADGGTVAVGASRPFLPGCPGQEQFQTTFYAALFSSISPGNVAGIETYQVLELETGKSVQYSGWGCGLRSARLDLAVGLAPPRQRLLWQRICRCGRRQWRWPPGLRNGSEAPTAS